MRLIWTLPARADRRGIYGHIEADNPRAAAEIDAIFDRRSAQLILHPLLGRPGRVPGTRELVVHSNYMLIYEVEGEAVLILRVMHVARRWPPGET